VRRFSSAGGLTTGRIVQAAKEALGSKQISGLSIAIVNDEFMSRLHDEYLGGNRPTDVLAFDLGDRADPAVIDGEIVVSGDTARREAARRGLTAGEELLRYVIHGALHLRGMNDRLPAERQRMRREENRILALLRVRPPAGSPRRGAPGRSPGGGRIPASDSSCRRKRRPPLDKAARKNERNRR